MENCYDKNETMKLLGHQVYSEIININELGKLIKDVAQARQVNFDVDAAYDIYTLGYIYGKRAERRRRKKNN